MFRLEKLIGMCVLLATMCVYGLAQTYPMPPPTGGGPPGPYMPGSKSYGHGAAIGAVIGAGAGAAALFYGVRHHRRNHAEVVGCVSPDGKSLATDDGKYNYEIAGTEKVNAGEHVSVAGKRSRSATGLDELDV